MRITKFIDYFVSLRKRFPTLKELEKRTIKENKIKKKCRQVKKWIFKNPFKMIFH